MSNLLILRPSVATGVSAASRGSGGANLMTPSPKEVWQDTATGSVNLDYDAGTFAYLDTIFLGGIGGAYPSTNTTWAISCGTASHTDTVLQTATPVRLDSAGTFPPVAHAIWTGATTLFRFVRITLTQGAGLPLLSAGVLMVGQKFQPAYPQEWGAGRRVIDTGSVTPLPNGGFAVVEGARKGSWSWTLGDLSLAEVDLLYDLQRDRGESKPIVVVEDPAATTGQLYRIHYGLFRGLRAFERRNPAQTRWELSMEEWV